VQTDKDNGVGNSKRIASFICLLTGMTFAGKASTILLLKCGIQLDRGQHVCCSSSLEFYWSNGFSADSCCCQMHMHVVICHFKAR
jgi:hypothetical protein